MQKEKVLKNYIKELKELCPELIDLIYPITKLGNDYAESFNEILDVDSDLILDDDVNLETNMDLVREFLKQFDSKYLEKFDKALESKIFDIYDINSNEKEIKEPLALESEHSYSISIPIKNQISDGANIVHEFFHYLNYESNDNLVRYIFSELISVYIEIKYFKFLSDKGYSDIYYKKEIYDRLENSFVASLNCCLTGATLDIYNNTGDITLKTVTAVNNYRKIYQNNITKIVNFSKDDEFEQAIYDFDYDVSYVLGGLLGIYLLREPQISDIKIKYLNENINRMTIENVLYLLDVRIEDYPIWIKYCLEKIKEIRGDLVEQINSYSRSNCSR